ncbi:hypothetical protein B5J94_13075 [Moraxella lacunata]|uniref:Uncharacterized protein n=2 Tax=Moraxella lacunata TaxID=477 RepID=A0A1V4GLF8_MORLA|nr:hypothetical protein B5J94_13075 [Moraxella lacunata]
MPAYFYVEKNGNEIQSKLIFNKNNQHVCAPYQKTYDIAYSLLYLGNGFIDDRYPTCYEFVNNKSELGFSPIPITESLKNLGFK